MKYSNLSSTLNEISTRIVTTEIPGRRKFYFVLDNIKLIDKVNNLNCIQNIYIFFIIKNFH